MLSLFSALFFKTSGHFSELEWSRLFSVTAMLIFWVKGIQQSTASMWTSWLLLNQQTRDDAQMMC